MENKENLQLVAKLLSTVTCQHGVIATVEVNEEGKYSFNNVCCGEHLNKLDLEFAKLAKKYDLG